jgi:4-hydroxythreonine-4-phosphate dehydrogenase
MLVITLGDPFSITQECLVQLSPLWAQSERWPVVLVGSLKQWHVQNQLFGFPPFPFEPIKNWSEVTRPGLYFYAIDGDERVLDPAQLSPLERGQIATRALQSLSKGLVLRKSLAVVTAPIDKHACALAGFRFPGQTEYFEDLWQKSGIMILAGPRLRVALASNHLPLAQVTPAIDEPLLLRKLHDLDISLRSTFQIESPRIAVAALNPHAGDGGLFGDEDTLILKPAIEKVRSLGLDVSGPFPADTVFFRAYEEAYDAVLAMYHDQGLAPLKALHFYDAINVTGALPALRVSPDHGPASDLYGLKKARNDSFRLALEAARRYLQTHV